MTLSKSNSLLIAKLKLTGKWEIVAMTGECIYVSLEICGYLSLKIVKKVNFTYDRLINLWSHGQRYYTPFMRQKIKKKFPKQVICTEYSCFLSLFMHLNSQDLHTYSHTSQLKLFLPLVLFINSGVTS